MKNKFLTKEEKVILKDARNILKRVAKYASKLKETRNWADENTDKDIGGKKWKDATAKYYDLLEEINKASIFLDLDDESTEICLMTKPVYPLK